MRIRKDVSNRIFGKLTALAPVGKKAAHTLWSCRCVCGKTRVTTVTSLLTGSTTSCGCKGKKDVQNRTFGRLVAQWPDGRDERSGENRIIWACSCECGNIVHVDEIKLRNGRKLSCGCLPKEQSSERTRKIFTTHRGTGTSEYRAYHGARNRCENPKCGGYPGYGGRGIKFELPSFEEFLAYIGPKPSPQHSLDRFPDNDGNYRFGNIRWATKKEQANNRRPSCQNRK